MVNSVPSCWRGKRNALEFLAVPRSGSKVGMTKRFLTAIMLVNSLVVLSCNRRTVTFDHEREAVQQAMGEARLLSASTPKRDSRSVEASWEYEIAGNLTDAKNRLRRAFSAYQLVREDEQALSFARFDGADSFYLTCQMIPGGKGSTRISIALKSSPG